MSIFKAFFGLGKIPQVVKFFEFKSFDDVNKMGGAIAQIKQQVREGGLQLTQAQQKFLDDQMKQVEMVFEKIQQPTKETGIKSTQSAKIFDLQGQEIDPRSKIMGGKQSETEAEIAERLGRENKQAVGNIRKKKLRDEISKLDDKIEARKLQLEQRGIEDFETDSLFNKLDEQRNDLELKLDFEDMVDPEDMAQGGRAGFKDGMSRRKFMQIMGGLAALPIVGKFFKAGKVAAPAVEAVKETVTQAPPYFFDLVNKIKLFGKQSKVGPRERVNEFTYTGKDGSDYVMTEDIVTGDIKITKDKLGGANYGDMSYDTIEDRTEMVFRKGQMDESTKGKKPPDEYEEYKVEFDQDGTAADATDIDEISKMEIIKEVSDEAPSIKKAGGGIARMLGE